MMATAMQQYAMRSGSIGSDWEGKGGGAAYKGRATEIDADICHGHIHTAQFPRDVITFVGSLTTYYYEGKALPIQPAIPT